MFPSFDEAIYHIKCHHFQPVPRQAWDSWECCGSTAGFEVPSAWSGLMLGVLATLTQRDIFVFVEMHQKNEGKCLQTQF